MRTALSLHSQLSHSDPGIAIEYSKSGLCDHLAASGLGTRSAMRDAIAAAITGAGMVAATVHGGGNSKAFFTGSMKQFLRANSAVMALPWTRHVIGQNDIAVLFGVTPRGATNVKFDVFTGIFGA